MIFNYNFLQRKNDVCINQIGKVNTSSFGQHIIANGYRFREEIAEPFGWINKAIRE